MVEVDLLSSLLAALVNQASSYTVAGVVPERMGNEHPSIAPYAVFQTGDGRLVLAVGTDRQFQSLCDAIGAPALAQEPHFLTNPVVWPTAMASARSSRSCSRLAQRRIGRHASPSCAFPPESSTTSRRHSRWRRALGLDPIVDLAGPDGSRIRLPRNPIRLSRTPASYRTPPPELPC